MESCLPVGSGVGRRGFRRGGDEWAVGFGGGWNWWWWSVLGLGLSRMVSEFV